LGDLALRAVDDSRLAFLPLGTILPVDVAADLDARVQPGIAHDLELEYEVLEVSLAQERIRAALNRGTHDGAVLDLVFGESATNRPPAERLAVKEGLPAPLVDREGGPRRGRNDGQTQDRDQPGMTSHGSFS